jgi:histidine ammonia-lyase
VTAHVLQIDGDSLTLEQLEQVARRGLSVELAPASRERVKRSRAVIDRILASGETVYGVNTGFGRLASEKVSNADLARLQRNLVLSHAAGVGEPLPEDAVRATMLLRANCLAKGYSGVREVVIDTLLAMLNARVHPRVPEQGSVGASGDLAPLAHLSLVLMGAGTCITPDGDRPGAECMRRAGIEPLVLEAKEGLALLNGTPVTAAIGTLAVLDSETLADTADVAGALSWEALEGTDAAFQTEIHNARPHAGQMMVAERLRRLVADSEIRDSHRGCGRVQDAYCLRCMPQVHGAVRDTLATVRRMLEVEINSATDNPLVFADPDRIVSGGNFHGEPIASAMDYLAIALCKLGSISERRIAAMMDPSTSGLPEPKDPVFARLPAFLTEHAGLNSGFMIAQVTAAALASENKTLAHPASVDTIPTSANQEDHVSMSTIAARKARRICDNTRAILAIELLSAAQGVEFRKRDGVQLQPGVGGRAALALVRKHVAHLDEDRELAPDIEGVTKLIAAGAIRGD